MCGKPAPQTRGRLVRLVARFARRRGWGGGRPMLSSCALSLPIGDIRGHSIGLMPCHGCSIWESMNRPLNWVCLACAFFVAATQVLAQGGGCVTDQSGKVVCGQPDASCASNQRGEILCTTPGGGMVPDQYGELLCGPGYCVRNQRGDVYCSNEPRGAAMVDQNGNAVCSGTCVRGTRQACVRPIAAT